MDAETKTALMISFLSFCLGVEACVIATMT